MIKAKKQPLVFKESDCSKTLYHIPCSSYNQHFNDTRNHSINEDPPLSSDLNIRPISDFLQDDINHEKYSIPNKVIK